MKENNFDFSVDLHCHTTMRTMHAPAAKEERNLWDENHNEAVGSFLSRIVFKLSKGIAKHSQTTFYHCIKGNVRLLFDSLYPIERGFLRFRKPVQKILGKKKIETLIVTSTGISSEQYRHYVDSDDYFAELNQQYEFLQQNQGASPCGNYRFKIVNSYQELQSFLSESKKHLAAIITIEGGHVFGCGTPQSEKADPKELEAQVLENIRKVKMWEHPPFFVTLAHHFWNQLCGHSATFPRSARITCNQEQGLDQGITSLGWAAIKELLSSNNGKRIIIDTRHMSVQSRKEYYKYLKEYNQKNPSDKIPVIASHASMNGFESMEESNQKVDNMAKKKNTAFDSWSLNISDEEARIIHDSGGLFGFMLDKGRNSGIKQLQRIEKRKDPKELKQGYLELLLNNIFRFVQAIDQKTAWDHITLGTDFDGVITHFDCYDGSAYISELKEDMISYLESSQYQKELWFGHEARQICDKIFRENAINLLKSHF